MRSLCFSKIMKSCVLVLAASLLFLAGCGQQSSSGSSASGPGVIDPGGGGGGGGGGGTTVGTTRITLTTSAATATVSNTGGAGGVELTVTVTRADGTPGDNLTSSNLVFTVSGITAGDYVITDPVEDGSVPGTYHAQFTSKKIGVATVYAAALLGRSTTSTVRFTADAATLVSLSADPSSIPNDGTPATLTCSVTDQFGNPVTNGTVSFAITSGVGTLSSTSAITPASDGTASVTLSSTTEGTINTRASFTSTGGGLVMNSLVVPVLVSAETFVAGLPYRIAVDSVSPSTIALRSSTSLTAVTSSRITISVFDVNGDLIPDPPLGVKNVSMSIYQGPGGGETLSGVALGEEYLTATVNGKAFADVNSGIYPGTLMIRVQVTKKSNGSDLTPPLVKQIPGPVMRGGAPFTLQLSSDNGITDNHVGDLTMNFNSYVRDRWSAFVADGTPVEFGTIVSERIFIPADVINDPPAKGDLSDSGGAGGYDKFSSAEIVASGLLPDDVIVITQPVSPYRGAHVIKEVDVADGAVYFYTPLPITNSSPLDLNFYAGHDVGAGFAPNNGTVNGKAVGSLTYPGRSLADNCTGAYVGAPAVIYSGTSGGTVGDAAFIRLPYVAPLNIPDFPLSGNIAANATYRIPIFIADSSSPTGYPIPYTDVYILVTNGSIIDPNTDGYANSEVIKTDCRGFATFTWVSPAAEGKSTFTISADGVQLKSSELTSK